MPQDATSPTDLQAAGQELTEAIARTETLGQAIEEHLDGVEKELEEIRRLGIPRASPAPG